MIVTIGDNSWQCYIARDLITGLSGVESLPPYTGMFFDLGEDKYRIDINMSSMFFPLDIIFIHSSGIVSGVLHNVQPGEEAYFIASNSLGARYFMEVNAGEAASVKVGDTVVTSGTESNIFGTVFLAVLVIAVLPFAIGLLSDKED